MALFLVVLLGGGASRTDVFSLLYLRPLTALALAILLVMVSRADLAPVRTPLVLLACFAGLIALQLVPLPPDLWLSLPGRARFAEAAQVAGIDQPWRPLTLTPDLAWSSLMALIPAFAALIAVGIMDERHRSATVPLVIAGTTATMFFAILQVSGGATSPAYLYEVTHTGSAVGLFSNRNHQAAFLALTLVLLRVWTLGPASSPQRAQLRNWLALVFAIVLVPLIFVTGSRAGLALGVIAFLIAAAVKPWSLRAGASSRRLRLVMLAGLAVFVAAVIYMVVFSTRSLALQRLSTLVLQDDARFLNTGVVLEIIGDFLPFGAGFGSFDKVFRIYELDTRLGPTYYNRAHNDLLELVLTGGLPALALFGVFLFWLGRRAFALYGAASRPSGTNDADRKADRALYRARGGVGVIVLLLLASLVDYPLRTPLLAFVFALAVGWVAVHQSLQKRA